MAHPQRRDSSGRKHEHFQHQPFGIAQIQQRHDQQDGRTFSLELVLDATGQRGSLPANLIPSGQRRQLGVDQFCPVLVHKPRRGRFPLLIHADQFVATSEDPGAHFTGLVGHDDPEIRYQTCRLLTNLHSYRIEFGPLVGKLLATLDDPDPLVRWYASLAIGSVVVPNQAVVSAIIAQFQDDQNHLVRVMAGTVLRDWFYNKRVQSPLSDAILEALPASMADPNATVRSLAVTITNAADESNVKPQPSLDELLAGTAPAPTSTAPHEEIGALLESFRSENYLEHELAGYRLALLGADASAALATALHRVDDSVAIHMLHAFGLISLAAAETIPVLAHTALTDERRSLRQTAADCLATLLGHDELGQELGARGMRLMLRGVTHPPWWCDPGDRLRLDPEPAIAGLVELVHGANWGEPTVRDLAVRALGLMDGAPVTAGRTLLKLQSAAGWSPEVHKSLKRLSPALEPAIPSLTAALARGVPEAEIEWRLELLLAAGRPGREALCRLGRRLRLPPDVQRKLQPLLVSSWMREPASPPAATPEFSNDPGAWITCGWLLALAVCGLLSVALSWWIAG